MHIVIVQDSCLPAALMFKHLVLKQIQSDANFNSSSIKDMNVILHILLYDNACAQHIPSDIKVQIQ